MAISAEYKYNFNRTKHPWVKKTQGFTDKDHSVLKKENDNGIIPLLINVMIWS